MLASANNIRVTCHQIKIRQKTNIKYMKNTTHDAKSVTALSFFLSNQMVPSRGNGRQPQPKCVACFQPTPSVCFGCDCRKPPSHTYVLNYNSCVSMSSAITAMRQVTVLAHRGTHVIFLTTASLKSSEWRPSVIAPVLFFSFKILQRLVLLGLQVAKHSWRLHCLTGEPVTTYYVEQAWYVGITHKDSKF